MSHTEFNKYRAAVEVLQRGRDLMVDDLADEILDQSDDLLEGGFQFHELLETQGTRLHFLSLLVQQLEQSADAFDEAQAATAPPPPVEPEPPKRRRKTRAKKFQSPAASENSTDDA